MVAYARETQRKQRFITPEEYLEREDRAETKSEYHDGVIVAMAGTSPEHDVIVFDVTGILSRDLGSGPCEGYTSDLRIQVPACNRYYYADLLVVCGEPHFQNIKGVRSLLNPALIIEVLSDTTATHDRGEKWTCYQTIESLQTYVLISQDRPVIEVYERHKKGWFYTATVGLESSVALDSVGCTLRLAEVYRRVPLPSGQPAMCDSARVPADAPPSQPDMLGA